MADCGAPPPRCVQAPPGGYSGDVVARSRPPPHATTKRPSQRPPTLPPDGAQASPLCCTALRNQATTSTFGWPPPQVAHRSRTALKHRRLHPLLGPFQRPPTVPAPNAVGRGRDAQPCSAQRRRPGWRLANPPRGAPPAARAAALRTLQEASRGSFPAEWGDARVLIPEGTGGAGLS